MTGTQRSQTHEGGKQREPEGMQIDVQAGCESRKNCNDKAAEAKKRIASIRTAAVDSE